MVVGGRGLHVAIFGGYYCLIILLIGPEMHILYSKTLAISDLMITIGHRTFSGQIGQMSYHSLACPDTFSVQPLQQSRA